MLMRPSSPMVTTSVLFTASAVQGLRSPSSNLWIPVHSVSLTNSVLPNCVVWILNWKAEPQDEDDTKRFWSTNYKSLCYCRYSYYYLGSFYLTLVSVTSPGNGWLFITNGYISGSSGFSSKLHSLMLFWLLSQLPVINEFVGFRGSGHQRILFTFSEVNVVCTFWVMICF